MNKSEKSGPLKEGKKMEFEREKNALNRELQLQIKQLEFETQKKSNRLVSNFQEKNVDKYFTQFGKTAENVK